MPLTLVTAATSEPVTVEEMKEHLNIDFDEDDTYIGDLITACRRLIGGWANRSYVNETWDEGRENWPKGKNEIRLTRAPVSSVTHIKYIDTDGATQTWDASNYTVVTGSEPGRVALKWSGSWPVSTLQPGLPITIRYVAGFGTSAVSVPEENKLAIKMLVAHFYSQREPVVVGTITSKVPYHLETLLMNEQVWV